MNLFIYIQGKSLIVIYDSSLYTCFLQICRLGLLYFFNIEQLSKSLYTGELRYLEFQGNGENTSSFPKFEIASYDVTRIHAHEQKCVHFRLELS